MGAVPIVIMCILHVNKEELPMRLLSLAEELKGNAYPGRGIVIGKSKDGKTAVTAYFIMGRSENSRNRVFVEDGAGIRTQHKFQEAELYGNRQDKSQSHHTCR